MKVLRENFGPYDPEGDAESDIMTIRMRENHHMTKFLIDFNEIASRLSWDEKAIAAQFYRAMPSRIKDEFIHRDRPSNLAELKKITAASDHRYWKRQEEIAKEKSTSNSAGKTSTNKSSNSSASNQKSSTNNQNKNSSSTFNQNRTSSSSSSSSKPNPQTKKTNSDTKSKLGTDGKLSPEERKRRFDEKLCLYCGQSGHSTANCPKSAAAKARVAVGGKSEPSGSKDKPTN
jgi:cobalamin biosynthesis Mg chelatase CobN